MTHRAVMWLKRITLKEVLFFGTIFLTIFFAAKLGQYFFFEWNSSPAVLWPPTGIALAIIWLWGYRYSTPIFLGLVVASFTGPVGYLIPAVVTTPAAQVLGAMTGAYLLKKFKFDGLFSRMRNVVYLLVIIVLTCMVAPTVTTTISWATGNLSTSAYFSWSRAWGGYVFSCLILFPVIVSWFKKDLYLSRRSVIEMAAVAALLVFAVYCLFWTRIAASYSFIIFGIFFIAHFWVALRFSSRAMTHALLVTTVISILGLYFSPAPDRALNTQLFNTELFLLLLVPIFYAFSALVKERVNMFEELKKVMERVENENDTKNEFIAVLAHELRNPLAPVKTTLEILGLQKLDDETSKLIQSAHKQVHSMRRLLDDLLDITRVSQGKFQLQIERTNLHAILSQSIEATKEIYADRKHAVSIKGDQNNSIWVNADPVRLEQVIVNVLHNAAKYTNPGGLVQVKYEVKGNFVEIKIKDNGQGIDKEHIQEIFEPFWQKNTAARSIGGIGIGLSLTKRITEMHGGTIVVESKGVGQGSTFVIRMPIFISDDKAGLGVSEKSHIPSRKFKILVVDDNEVAADALTKLLNLKGHSAESTYDGSAVFEAVNRFKPEIILVDIGLPDMSGYEVSKRLRTNSFEGSLVAVSGYGQEEDKQKARQAGFDHHFTKPVAIAKLEEYFTTI